MSDENVVDFPPVDAPFQGGKFGEDVEEKEEKDTKKRIAILTNFQDFNAGYSLSGIVVEQCRMLLRFGHIVYLYVNENFNPAYNADAGLEELQEKYPHMLAVLKKTKFMHLRDYETAMLFTEEHKIASKECAEIYVEEFLKRKVDVVFTHDFIFTGWNLPYAAAVKITSEILYNEHKKILQWLHWIHSVPSNKKDWWNLGDYGPGHRIVFPNETESIRVAEHFSTTKGFVYTIPHIKDIRVWHNFSEESMKITYEYTNIMRSEILQVYPCSTDRLSAKQLDLMIGLFAEMKRANVNVCLVAANQWATGRQRKEDIHRYIKKAEDAGLVYGEHFIFTSEITEHQSLVNDLRAVMSPAELEDLYAKNSDLLGKAYKVGSATTENLEDKIGELISKLQPYDKGIPRKVIRDLQLIQNLFIFPTREESFGLVGPEAAYSGALVVSNRSLLMMKEVLGTGTLSFDFGSHTNEVHRIKEPEYIKAIAMTILERIYSSEVLFTGTYCRRKYNMDYLYYRYYMPIIR